MSWLEIWAMMQVFGMVLGVGLFTLFMIVYLWLEFTNEKK